MILWFALLRATCNRTYSRVTEVTNAIVGEDRYCIDCTYAEPDRSFFMKGLRWKYAKCMRPQHSSTRVNLVTGRKTITYIKLECHSERNNKTLCGPEGKFWERKKSWWERSREPKNGS